MLGLLLENGPLNIDVNGNVVQNNFSWDQLVDYIWVDQPVYVYFPPYYRYYVTNSCVQWCGILNRRFYGLWYVPKVLSQYVMIFSSILVDDEDQMGQDFVRIGKTFIYFQRANCHV